MSISSFQKISPKEKSINESTQNKYKKKTDGISNISDNRLVEKREKERDKLVHTDISSLLRQAIQNQTRESLLSNRDSLHEY